MDDGAVGSTLFSCLMHHNLAKMVQYPYYVYISTMDSKLQHLWDNVVIG